MKKQGSSDGKALQLKIRTDHKNFSPETLGGAAMHIVIVVDYPHAVYNYAIAAGAKVECPVRDEPHGWRIGKLRDPFGHAWEIGKKLK